MALLTTSNLFAFMFGVILAHIIHRRFFPTKFVYNRVAPTRIAFEAVLISTAVNYLRRLCPFIRKHTVGALWGCTSKHKVLLDDSLVARLLCQPTHILTRTPMTLSMYVGPIGTRNYDNLGEKLVPQLQASTESAVRNFMSDERVDEFLKQLNMPAKVASLVNLSNSSNPGHWEHCVRLQTLSPDNLPDSVIVDNFYQLIRDFGTYLNILVMFGQEFYDRNPRIVYDYWKWDDQALMPILCGIPERFPLKSLREGIAARTRIQRAMTFFSMNVRDKLANISDVLCTIVPDTIASRTTYGYTKAQEATFLHAHLFGASANLNSTLAWFLFFIYSTPGLVETLRQEIDPWVVVSPGSSPARIEWMDHLNLGRRCPRLKSALLETYRMVTEPYSIRYTQKSFNLETGNGTTHHIKAGTYVSVPLAMSNGDPDVYPNPEEYVPDRFIGKDPVTGLEVVRYGKLKPWGVGPSFCKGRVYAERLSASVAAAIITMWDVTPSGGEWPECRRMAYGSGTRKLAEGEKIGVIIKPRAHVEQN